MFRYPVSLLTAAAVTEGIVKCLCVKYKTDGVDGRGRPVGERNRRSLRKVAQKCSREGGWDIRDILEIDEVSSPTLRACVFRIRECLTWFYRTNLSLVKNG